MSLRTTALFVAWCIVTIVATAHHEPWRDEADNWLVVRDLGVVEVWRLLKYVGQPVLWYLVQLPAVKLGAAYHWQQIIHWPIAAAAVAVLLVRAPFTLPTRALIAGSYFFVYEYSVIARGYALTVLFLLLVCSFTRPSRQGLRHGAALALLANATSMGLFLACAYQLCALVDLVVARVRRGERLRLRGTLGLLLGWEGTAIALLQLFPQPEDGQKPPMAGDVDALLVAFTEGIVPLGASGPLGAIEVRLAMALAWFASMLWLLRGSRFALGFFLTSSGLFAYLFYAVHAGYLRHWGFFLVAGIAACWIALERSAADLSLAGAEVVELPAARPWRAAAVWCQGAALGVSTVILMGWCVRGAEQVVREIRMPFSNARDMAMYIQRHGLQQRVIAAHKAEVAVAILPWLPGTKLWYPEQQRWGTHMRWDQELREGRAIRQPAALRRVKRRFPRWRDERRGVLFLTSMPLPDPAKEGYVLLHASDAPLCSAHGENFWLYGPSRPSTRR